MKVWVNVDRQKAILAGRNEEGWKMVEVDMGKLSQEERGYVASRANSRHYNTDYAQEIGGCVAEATEEATIKCIQEQVVCERASAEKKRKEVAEKINALLSKGIEGNLCQGYVSIRNKAFTGWQYSNYAFEVDGRRITDPRIIELIEKVEKERDVRNEAIYQDLLRKEAEDEAKNEAVKAEKARKEAQKKEQIRKWVSEKGTENQQKRYEIDLLPASEVTDAIRDEAYMALDDCKRYEKMRASDVCTCEDKYDDRTGDPTLCDVDFDVRGATEATAEEYAAMEKIAEKIKKVQPSAVITMTDHVGAGSDCENEVVCKSVKVEIKVGAFNFSREYAI